VRFLVFVVGETKPIEADFAGARDYVNHRGIPYATFSSTLAERFTTRSRLQLARTGVTDSSCVASMPNLAIEARREHPPVSHCEAEKLEKATLH
jgi:hypothetical protein